MLYHFLDQPSSITTVPTKVADLEATRDLTKIIVHVDLDAFYASVEVLDDPSLTGKPFGVGHGVLSTANYEARKYGVRSGMASSSSVFFWAGQHPNEYLARQHLSRENYVLIL